MSDDYTPTTEELIRGYVAVPYMVSPRAKGEEFSSWLSRCSIESMHSDINSERAARRWLAEHDRQVAELVHNETVAEMVSTWMSGKPLTIPVNIYAKDGGTP